MRVSVPRDGAPDDPVLFGKYRFVAYVGEGGMGDVFLAVLLGPVGFHKLQVIKRLKPHLARKKAYVTMFLDEARLAARLNHPNVVQTNEVGEEHGHYFLAMEYLDGQPLSEILERAPKDEAWRNVLISIVADALAGLHYAHELADYDGRPLNVVHRDASPHNVFVTYDGHVKLVDFGVAKSDAKETQSGVGVIKGKLAYMSPEQARAEPVDRRADLFAIGVSLWEIATGERLWKEMTETHMLFRLTNGTIPKVGDTRADIPAELARICDSALAPARNDRFATAQALRQALLAYLEARGARVPPEEIGKKLADLFADNRDELASVLETHLRALSESESGAGVESLPAIHVRAFAELPVARKRRGLEPSAATLSMTAEPLDEDAPTAAMARRPLIVLGSGVIALVAAAFLWTRAAPTPQPGASLPTVSATTSSAPEPPPRVQITLTATPTSAQLFIDDTPAAANPFSSLLPRDAVAHRVRAEAPGFTTASQLVTFDRDATVTIVLAPLPAPPAAPVASAKKPPPSVKRTIDEKNPF